MALIHVCTLGPPRAHTRREGYTYVASMYTLTGVCFVGSTSALTKPTDRQTDRQTDTIRTDREGEIERGYAGRGRRPADGRAGGTHANKGGGRGGGMQIHPSIHPLCACIPMICTHVYATIHTYIRTWTALITRHTYMHAMVVSVSLICIILCSHTHTHTRARIHTHRRKKTSPSASQ